jgi:hypothetical protein
MLNLLQPQPPHRRGAWRETHGAVACGLLLGALCVLLQETDAASALANSHLQAGSAAQWAGLPEAEVSNHALVAAEQPVAQSLTRQTFLELRQARREDGTDVQETWLLRRLGGTQARVKLQSQQWQQGLFSWEGVAAEPTDLDRLLHSLNRFPRWVQAPVLVHIQTAPTEPGASPRKGLAFQLQARLYPAQGPQP